MRVGYSYGDGCGTGTGWWRWLVAMAVACTDYCHSQFIIHFLPAIHHSQFIIINSP
jgi:hypothetical protein